MEAAAGSEIAHVFRVCIRVCEARAVRNCAAARGAVVDDEALAVALAISA